MKNIQKKIQLYFFPGPKDPNTNQIQQKNQIIFQIYFFNNIKILSSELNEQKKKERIKSTNKQKKKELSDDNSEDTFRFWYGVKQKNKDFVFIKKKFTNLHQKI